MISVLKDLIRGLFYGLYRVLPKRDHAVVYGWPDFEDTVLALQKELQATSLRRIVVFVSGSGTRTSFPLGDKVRVVRKNSIAGVLHFLFSRYVFFTHPCFLRRFPSNVVSVNLWHGMPVKRIGWMLEGNQGVESQHCLATSDFWQPVMERSMRPFGGVLVTGNPRNDRLSLRSDDLWSRLGAPQAAEGAKLIVWLPTYRRSVVGELRVDGRECGSVFGIDGADAEELNAFFRERNVFGVVKPHPMAPRPELTRLSHLWILDDATLRERGVSLYELLGRADALITDISSVYVDYLILDRPVFHCFSDLTEYQTSRGFTLDPVGEYFAGPLATNAEQLLAELERWIGGEDSHAAKRKELRALFHQDPNEKSCERLLREVGLAATPR